MKKIMNVLLKVSVFVLQSNSCRSIIKTDFLNQISYLEQLKLKLLRNQDLFPTISRFITKASHKQQWYTLTSPQGNLKRESHLQLPQIPWVARRGSVRKLIEKQLISNSLFTFGKAQVLGTV